MTDDRKPDIFGGRFYGRTDRGRLEETTPEAAGRLPDVWICRRVDDFPDRRSPSGSELALCRDCGAVIAFNPARTDGVPPGTPKVCMQCAKIQPLPIEPRT